MREIAANSYVVFYMLQRIFSTIAKLVTLIFFHFHSLSAKIEAILQ